MRRERARPCGTHPHEVLSCHVPALHIRHAALPADQQCRGVVDCDGASHAFHVLLVSLYRTPRAIEAAWKYFILCGVGIAQALFGPCFSISPLKRCLERAGCTAMDESKQGQRTARAYGIVAGLRLPDVGYGTKVGLVPLHNWLPDAHSEGPTPISAVLSGLLLNIALYALSVQGPCRRLYPDPSCWRHHDGFGILSILVAAFSLLSRRT